MSAESMSEAMDEARTRLRTSIREVMWANWHDGRLDGITDEAVTDWLLSPEGRRALLDVLQPTPDEVGGARVIGELITVNGVLHGLFAFPSERDG